MTTGTELTTVSAAGMLALPEELTRQFYDWERRGRGWQVWEYPVALEPPFRPCFYYLPDAPADEEAGRRHTWLSRLTRNLLGRGKRNEPIEPAFILPEPEPEFVSEDGEIVEYEVTLPASADVDKSVSEQLILNLSYCVGPIGYEVVGAADGIYLQYACQERDVALLEQQLHAHLPEAVIRQRNKGLERAWRESRGRESVVVDFGLCHEFVRPLRTFRTFAADPFTGIAAALSRLRSGEIGIFQILFAPTRAPWAQNVFYAVTDTEGGSFFADAPEMPTLAREKISLPLYATVIRVAAKSSSYDRSMEIARGLGSALAQFGNPGSNELIPLSNDEYPDRLHERDLLTRQSRRSGLILNSDELVCIAHPPSAAVQVPKLNRIVERTKAAPAISQNHALVLGENAHNGQSTRVTLNDDQRCKHMYVVGASGTGKSTFLLNLITQDIEAGRGIAVLDPHGDLIDETLARIPESRQQDVVLFDPSDSEFPIGFNILSAHSELEKTLIASDLVSVFQRLSTSWGDQMTTVFNNAILAMLESRDGGTLGDLRRFLVEKPFRERFLETVTDSELVYYWRKEFPMLSGRPQVPILTRLDAFLRPKPIRHMVAQKTNKLDFADIMNTSMIFLAKLAQGAIGEENSHLLGTLLVSKIHQITLSRQEMQAAQRRPFFMYIDEFQNFITPSMSAILSGVRKYRLGLVLAHQELRQIEKRDSEVASAALANPYTRVCFRVGDSDARKLAEGFRYFEASDLQDLSTGQAVCRIERADYDFNLSTPMAARMSDAIRDRRHGQIRALSRGRYGTPRGEVEAALERERPAPVWPYTPEREAEKPARSETLAPAEVDPETGRQESEPPAANHTVESTATSEKELVAEPKRPRTLRPVTPPAPMGKGGQQHKYLQNLIKRWAEGMGYRASIEKQIQGGNGSVDVVLEKGNVSIAIEVSVTTTSDHEVGNIQKCLAEPFTHICFVATDAKKLASVTRAVEPVLNAPDRSRLRLCAIDDLFAFIEQLESQNATTTKNVRGYKVKVNYAPVGTDEDKKARRKTVAQVIAKAIRKGKT